MLQPWGERVTFLFDPNGDHVPKTLHVSPFLDMNRTRSMALKDSDSRGRLLEVRRLYPSDIGSWYSQSKFAGCPYASRLLTEGGCRGMPCNRLSSPHGADTALIRVKSTWLRTKLLWIDRGL
eukprot:768624-Hanusia_phi.AAC.11